MANGTAGPASTGVSETHAGPRDLGGRLALGAVLKRLIGRSSTLTLGRYRVRERIGRGGCGVVLLADDPELDREVAIKVVLPLRSSAARRAAAHAALHDEARALARLRHPNVVEVFDVGTGSFEDDDGDSSGIYLVMELLRGMTLAEWVAEHRPPAAEIIAVYRKAAAGLIAAHDAGIVHRDFKPENVLLTDDGRVKVIDFGLAHAALPSEDSSSELGADASGENAIPTLQGKVVGTPLYMAPEQHAGSVVGPAADQYAWCASLYRALAGRAPFTGDTLEDLVDAKRHERPRGLPSFVPLRVRRALRRGLAVEAGRRFADMRALLAAMLPRKRLRGWTGVALAGAVVAVPAAALVNDDRAVHACDLAGERLDEVWSDARRDELVRTMAAFTDPDAPAIASKLGVLLDRHAHRWQLAFADVCRDDGSDRRLAERVACMQHDLEMFDQAITTLGTLAPERMGNSAAVVGNLRDPSACAAIESTERAPAERDELAGLWRRADAIAVEIDADGESDDAAWIEVGRARAEELGDATLASWLAQQQGRIERAAGQLDAAEAHTRAAVFGAAAAHDYRRALAAVPFLLLSVGVDRRDRAEAEQLAEHARTMAGHLDDGREALGNIDAFMAQVALEVNDIPEAVRLYKRALATYESLPEPPRDMPRVLLAQAGYTVGEDVDEAERLLERAEEVLDRISLPSDLNYAAVDYNRAAIATLRGDIDGAAELYQRTVSRLRKRLHGHPYTAMGIEALASAEVRRGRFAIAADLLDEAREIVVAVQGEGHPDSIHLAMQRSHVAWQRGEDVLAVEWARKALAGLELGEGRQAGTPQRAHVWAGWAELARGDLGAAREHVAAAAALERGLSLPAELPLDRRRLAAAIAWLDGDRDQARAELAIGVPGVGELDDDEAALQRALDRALTAAIDGDPIRPSLAELPAHVRADVWCFAEVLVRLRRGAGRPTPIDAVPFATITRGD